MSLEKEEKEYREIKKILQEVQTAQELIENIHEQCLGNVLLEEFKTKGFDSTSLDQDIEINEADSYLYEIDYTLRNLEELLKELLVQMKSQ